MACPAPHDKTAHGTNGTNLQERGRKVRPVRQHVLESVRCMRANERRVQHVQVHNRSCVKAQTVSNYISLHTWQRESQKHLQQLTTTPEAMINRVILTQQVSVGAQTATLAHDAEHKPLQACHRPPSCTGMTTEKQPARECPVLHASARTPRRQVSALDQPRRHSKPVGEVFGPPIGASEAASGSSTLPEVRWSDVSQAAAGV